MRNSRSEYAIRGCKRQTKYYEHALSKLKDPHAMGVLAVTGDTQRERAF